MSATSFTPATKLPVDGAGGRRSIGRSLVNGLLEHHTGAELGKKLGVSQQYIALLAVGARTPSTEVIYAFEDLFGFPPRAWHRNARLQLPVVEPVATTKGEANASGHDDAAE